MMKKQKIMDGKLEKAPGKGSRVKGEGQVARWAVRMGG